MATPKKPTANQRESRVPTPPKLPKGGGTAASGSKLVQPTTKTTDNQSIASKYGISNKDISDILKAMSGINTDFEKLNKDVKKKIEDDEKIFKGGDDGSGGQQPPKEDAGLAYSKMQDEKARQDAFAILKDVFASYGLDTLASEIEGYMREGIGTSQATLKLKQSQAYKDRFKGNELRRASGFNVISEAEYLDLENSYSQTLKAYGIQDYFGVAVTPTQRLARQQSMAEVIGKDISAVEFKDRVSTAVDRVKMADPGTKSAFQNFYGVGETELVKYFLDPVKSLVSLKEKATAAEIGGAAIGQNLPATMATAEELARFGINREQAQAGYSTIAQELPTAAKLGQIYDEEGITYGQTEAEQATFKGLASAKRKKERLVAREQASFQGSSGVGAAGLSTTYLRKGSAAGQF